MLLFKKKQNAGTDDFGPLPRELKTVTAALISAANRAEAQKQHKTGLENTSAGEVLAARDLVGVQKELLRVMAAASCRGMSVAQIERDVIEPAIDNSVVGDMAWLMLSNVLENARNKERAGDGRIELKDVAGL